MKNSEVEYKLKTAVEHAVPDVLAVILSRCEEQKGEVIPMPQAKKKNWRKSLIIAAAALALMAGAAAGYTQYHSSQKVLAIIGLDVNPSMELKINKAEKVLAVTALNEDAEIILAGMEIKGTDLNVAVNALIGSMLKNGYISELANSILISVENAEGIQGSQLQLRLAEEINSLLQASSINAAILSQAIDANQELQALADTYGISLGKASLIKKILARNVLFNPEDLAGLSINELNLLVGARSEELLDVTLTGAASDKAYIGEGAAKQIAFADAEVLETDVFKLDLELGLDHGKMAYELEFSAGSGRYEYKIDAKTGAIIKAESKNDRKPTGNLISEEEAKAIALAHAGVSASSARNMELELEDDDDSAVYEIAFKCGDSEYEYKIDAVTGEIIDFEFDDEDEVDDDNDEDEEDDDDDGDDDDDDDDGDDDDDEDDGDED